jgi:hypothetical protein
MVDPENQVYLLFLVKFGLSQWAYKYFLTSVGLWDYFKDNSTTECWKLLALDHLTK